MNRAILTTLTLAMAACFSLAPSASRAGTGTTLLQASAIILGKGNCSFMTTGAPPLPPYAITFASPLDPFAPVDRSASVTFSVKCTGLGNGGGTVVVDRAGAGQLYLKNGAATIPYSLNLPTSQPVTNNTPTPITLTATIAGNDYRNAAAGNYTDTITINISP